MEIKEHILLTPETAKVFVDRLFDIKQFWLDRGHFYTLGTSAYIDSPTIYPGLAANTNIVIDANFKYLSSLVANYFKEEFSREIIVFPNKGLPGFHIFGDESNGMEASIHTDEAHDRLEWGCEVSDPFSFTLPMLLPEAGGGLNWWESQVAADDPKCMPNYLAYEVGKLVWFPGEMPHQIANNEELTDKDFRITYQGHGITLDTGKIAVYF